MRTRRRWVNTLQVSHWIRSLHINQSRAGRGVQYRVYDQRLMIYKTGPEPARRETSRDAVPLMARPEAGVSADVCCIEGFSLCRERFTS